MKKRRWLSALLSIALMLSFVGTVSAAETDKGYIDNSSLMPKYVTDDKVKLEDSGNGLMSPDWVKTLIVEEINIQKASPNGKLSGMTYVLDHVQEMGVNGIWIDPIYDGKHYLNYGPHTVNTYITGTLDYDEGWKVVKKFVDEAHKRNIRVFFDIVTWGVSNVSDLYINHPNWFNGWSEDYGGPLLDWENEELFNWFLEEMKDIIRKTGADGFRADCGIDYCGPKLYKKVRSDLLAEGKKIALIGESVTDENLGIFDFAEHSVNLETGNIWKTGIFYTEMYNIVDSVKNGTGIGSKEQQEKGTSGQRRFYSSLVSCHDFQNYVAEGNLVTMGYASILSPFIPMWYIGEEWNNSYTSNKGWIYSTGINWKLIDSNRDYYEQVKALIRIRRKYSDIFEFFPKNHRDSNICAVKTDHILGLTGYARYGSGKAVIVIPNLSEYNDRFNITVPYVDMGLSVNGNYKITNLLTNKVVVAGSASDILGFEVSIPVKNVAVYLVEEATVLDIKNYGITVPSLPKKNTSTTDITSLNESISSDDSTNDVDDDKNGSTQFDNASTNDEKVKGNDTSKNEEKSLGILWYILGAVVLIVVISGMVVVILIKKHKTTFR